MFIRTLHVSGYRSLRKVALELGPLTVIAGPNGSGKTNLYRTMYLVHAAAAGGLSRALAEEGGMPSVLWAGAQKKSAPRRVTLAVELDELEYEIAFGLPIPDASAFTLDPVVKEESVSFTDRGRAVELLGRGAGSAMLRDAEGNRVTFPYLLSESESVLSQLAEPHRFPVLSRLRQELLGWRFYHQFRTDAESALRQPQVGIRTPILSHDGRDLAAALQTIFEIGDGRRLVAHVERAFPGAALEIARGEARFAVRMRMPGIARPLEAHELSDGTLRYLCLMAALLSPRAPPLIALNEPETSLHPDLFAPLAELIIDAAKHSQLWVTTHAEPLVTRLATARDAQVVHLNRDGGETELV